jgi:hypothetical protein
MRVNASRKWSLAPGCRLAHPGLTANTALRIPLRAFGLARDAR